MIKILDSNFKLQAILNKAINPNRFEELNGENTLTFSAILDEKVANYLNENSVIELENDYFDIAYLEKKQNEDGTLTVNVETEHISYRLNNTEYDKEWFAEIGSPTLILGKILAGTGFTIGTVEFTTTLTYSAQEKKSRRQLLMEFTHLLGGELIFDKFTISIVKHRGNTEPEIFTKGKNIKVVSKIYNKREKDEEGNPLVAYVCEPILLSNKKIGIGDEALLIQKDLGIREQLRVVRYGYNPYDNREAEIELANFISGLEDDIYRIETSTLAKEKVYNGIRIGPDEGFVAERSDLKAKTIMNATEGISIYSNVGYGLERNFFVDTNGRIQAKEIDIAGDGTFEGTITASDIIGGTINIGNGTFTVDSQGRMIAKSGTFEGTISTTKDIEAGDNIYLGESGVGTGKGLYFAYGYSQESSIILKTNGRLEIFNWDDLLVDSADNTAVSAFYNLDLSGDNIFLDAATNVNINAYSGKVNIKGTSVILDWDCFIGNDSTDDNLIATLGDIGGYIKPYYSSNLCYIDAGPTQLVIRDKNGVTMGQIPYSQGV